MACTYLVYDLQLIMGGKNYALSPDEYVFVRVCSGVCSSVCSNP